MGVARRPLEESEMGNSNLQAIAARLSFPTNQSMNEEGGKFCLNFNG